MHPEWMTACRVGELDALYADGATSATRPCARFRASSTASRRVLRLHPPADPLMRKVMHRLPLQGLDGARPASSSRASPAVSNRMPEHVSGCPSASTPTALRRRVARGGSPDLFAWIPFGAGRHRCVGAAFAMMQLKAIFSRSCCARLRVRDGPIARELSQRPLEDGGGNFDSPVACATASASPRGPRRRSPPEPPPTSRPRAPAASKSTWTCARATPCA